MDMADHVPGPGRKIGPGQSLDIGNHIPGSGLETSPGQGSTGAAIGNVHATTLAPGCLLAGAKEITKIAKNEVSMLRQSSREP